MKFAALITVAALTCGAAFAQGYGSGTSRDSAANRDPSAAVATDKESKPAGEGIVEKTKRAFQRLGDKIRSAGSKSKDADKTAAQSDTRSMGAAGTDSERKARMDEAYANSKKAKPQDK